ncbi:DUF5316 domain-containing protein [Brevibacillus sp. TJ4]|uniref:DUF5316 domain-containing protein n=1 Tax=Brevibacillus sp. TJ4 TaxID=3234853 RepID=UPI003BA3C626
MKVSILTGLGLLLLSTVGYLLTNDLFFIVKLSGSAGLLCFLLSAVFTGSLNSGDRIRANDATESKEDRRTRRKWAIHLALVGLPNFMAAFVILLYTFSG